MQIHSFPVIVLVALFVTALVAIGVVVYLALKLLNRKPGDGSSSFSGCAIAAVIGCLGMLALGAAAVLFVGLIAYRASARGFSITHRQRNAQGAEEVRIEPIEPTGPTAQDRANSIESARHRIHFVFHVRGADADTSELESFVRGATGSQPSTTRGIARDAKGETYTRIELSVQLDDARVDAADLDVRSAVERSDAGQNGSIEYEGIERDV